ncbi:anhydro-N-acetylmuramic acid kinase [Marivibrio halodurans]|uniref:Anhydro-N-acetylmuramic acid kinase n=1 Tax=Marivibrio halodurans TaxID=2039722 RepID=A0A8J7RYE9_9PROT|nr:anhydro-N-acetylmuramic acid kinase [Marivibrio halodurans]MBP5857027.1 anhydro-N-acetylmuramic acid kinase [Marivibrio halodurans]
MKTLNAIGLMSGTSFDGIDVALIETDGDRLVRPRAAIARPYPDDARAALRHCLNATERSAALDAVERTVTVAQCAAVEALLEEAGVSAAAIDVVGFHGQTITHVPPRDGKAGWTWQLGDGQTMADRLGIPTVFDFRAADMAGGGEGAPLAPVYHRALAAAWAEFPAAFLNIGGVSNLTYLAGAEAVPIGFDTGPGNAPIDDLVAARLRLAMDAGGRIAAAGRVDPAALDRLMADPYFARPYPKSLDRNAFDLSPVEALGTEDAAATLVAFLVEGVARGADLLPTHPARWFVTGGGRRNPAIMAALADRLGVPVEPVEATGADGDVLEAEAFAYMAVRHLKGWPTSYPEMTGTAAPCVGGRLARPSAATVRAAQG